MQCNHLSFGKLTFGKSSLGLPLLALSLVDIPLASLVSSTLWLQLERTYMLDDGDFLLSISEALSGRIYGVG